MIYIFEENLNVVNVWNQYIKNIKHIAYITVQEMTK